MSEEERLKAIVDRLTKLSGKITPPLPDSAIAPEARATLIAGLSTLLDNLEGEIKKLPGRDEPYASEAARIAEYNSLCSFINSRDTQQMTLNGFLVSGAVLALTFALKNESARIGGTVALFPALLIIIAWTNLHGIRYLDGVTYARIRDIEELLNIGGLGGHSGIYKKVKTRPQYKAREYVWYFFYSILLAASLIISVYLFWPAVFPKLPPPFG